MGKKLSSRLSSFKAYCERQKIELLRDDLLFIDTMLNSVDRIDFKTVLTRYLEKWHEGTYQGSNSLQGQNLSRRNANSWLMGYVDEIRKKN